MSIFRFLRVCKADFLTKKLGGKAGLRLPPSQKIQTKKTRERKKLFRVFLCKKAIFASPIFKRIFRASALRGLEEFPAGSVVRAAFQNFRGRAEFFGILFRDPLRVGLRKFGADKRHNRPPESAAAKARAVNVFVGL